MKTLTAVVVGAAAFPSRGLASQQQHQAQINLAPQSGLCCNVLYEGGLGDKVYHPLSASYEDRMDTYWSVSAALRPWCMVQPQSTEDVSLIMKLLVNHDCPFGVRSGGHSFFPGSNSVEEGVTIDFGNMNATTYDPETKLASIQPGARWQDVYEALVPHGVTVTGGRAGTVGVGGFLTGGGNSFHSGSHGMGCDNVARFELVLADGSVVGAGAGENADLWRAMKGSSANLALATRFDMYAIEFPDPAATDIWGGLLAFELGAGPDLAQAYVDFTDNVPRDQNSSSLLWWAYVPAMGGMMLNLAMENTEARIAPPAFDRYFQVEGLTANTMRVAPMTEITQELGSGAPGGFRDIWFVFLFKNDPRMITFAAEEHERVVARLGATLSEASNFNTLCFFQSMNGIVARHGRERGGNVMGLDAALEGGNGVMFLFTLALDGADQEELAMPLVAEYARRIDEFGRETGGGLGWKYLNYAPPWQDPMASFGEEALARVRAAAEKYDPHGVFQRLRRSGIKIPRT